MALLKLSTVLVLLKLLCCLHTAQTAEKVSEVTCSCNPGVPGTPGHNGLNGRDGKEGATGPKGEKGDPGMTGPQGHPGKAGPPGLVGPAGRQGLDGLPGQNGRDGLKGEKGEAGVPGSLPDINFVELQSEVRAQRDLLNKITQLMLTKRVGTKYFVTDKKSGKFDEAVKLCSSVNGVPAQPVNAQENQALSAFLSGSEYAWISANDRKTEGKFVDLREKELKFNSWKTSEPNNHKGVEDCAIILPDGKWNDINCDSSFLIICEI
ncbi:hypothetical protein GJAV_G00001170 [Gymnothorax javanicus]|nr:hypothetical protein GJAV_G00001170 [Gymnothorax javanicus]